MLTRTKIVATLGPATATQPMIRRLAEVGADVFRINFSHGTVEGRAALLRDVRAVEREIGRPLAVLADLCGPKIRVGPIAGGEVELRDGATVSIVRALEQGTAERIATTLPELVDELRPGERVLLDDGRLRLEVVESRPPDEVICRVIHGGPLSSGKGINLPRTRLSVDSLTEKDLGDIDWIAATDADYVALSFVRDGATLDRLRGLLRERGCGAHVVAKVEKPEALERIDEIVEAADAIMVARGDLGVEMELPAVPLAQKRIARLCQRAGKPCIIATQMLDSMTHAARPTRAEVSDVANAVLDHADAVMLSGETAIGEYPVEAVRTMDEILSATQAYDREHGAPELTLHAAAATTAALAGAVRVLLDGIDARAVAVFTASGTTARLLAKARMPVPVLALSGDRAAVRRMQLYHGVFARRADAPEHTRDVLALAARFARDLRVAAAGERIVVLSGRPIGVRGRTNTLVVHEVE